MYSNVGSICTAIADMSSNHKWPHTGTNLELEQLVRSHKDLWSQSKNDAGLLKDFEVDIEGRDPKPQPQYKLPLESIQFLPLYRSFYRKKF
ncbi:unnamed protein product [Staurois parvus]|uniref:Uncharacterized protein n=1 Tax=Staurois parvus TaxID=386267 RepID=A0ABN9GHY3_9NEOB|nr:unnamed protein product [Staurois parvus]